MLLALHKVSPLKTGVNLLTQLSNAQSQEVLGITVVAFQAPQWGGGDDLIPDRGTWLLSNPHMQWDKQSLPTWALFTSRGCLKQACVSSIPQRDSLHGNNIRGVFLSFPEAKQKELHPL